MERSPVWATLYDSSTRTYHKALDFLTALAKSDFAITVFQHRCAFTHHAHSHPSPHSPFLKHLWSASVFAQSPKVDWTYTVGVLFFSSTLLHTYALYTRSHLGVAQCSSTGCSVLVAAERFLRVSYCSVSRCCCGHTVLVHFTFLSGFLQSVPDLQADGKKPKK